MMSSKSRLLSRCIHNVASQGFARQVGTDTRILLFLQCNAAPHYTLQCILTGTPYTQAAKYEATRPSYPPESVDFIVNCCRPSSPDTPYKKVLDLAAGTGKFTRLLAQYPSLQVSAVEPVEGMRIEFKRALPSKVSVVEGTSTRIPFDDDYFDLVTIAQAFHWFSNIESLKEIKRVLRPSSGVLAMIWNLEDASIPWIKSLRNAYETYDLNVPQYRRRENWQAVFKSPEAQSLFSCWPLQSKFFSHDMMVSKEEVWHRVLSKSYVSSLSAEEQEVVKAKVYDVLNMHDDAFHHIQEDGRRCAKQRLITEVALASAKPLS